MAGKRRVLGISVASGRVGHLLMIDAKIADLGMSRKASTGPVEAQSYAAQRIESLRPDVVVTEKVLTKSKKGAKARAIIAAITSVADVADVLNVEVVRGHSHTNRFEEAQDLVWRYPALRRYLPKVRKPWESEPKALIYFEALSLIESVFGQLASERREAA